MPTLLRTDRVEYRGSDLLPDVETLGWTRLQAAGTSGLGEHRHDGFEICLLVRGTMDWWAGDHEYTVPAGHIYVTGPEEPHGAETAQLQPCDLFWLILRPDAPEAAILQGLPLAAHRVAPATAALREAFRALHDEHRHPDEPAAEAARGWLRVLVIEARRAVLQRAAEPRPSEALAKAMADAMERLETGISIEAMALTAQLSPSRFQARFRMEVGEPPAAWVRRQRLERAKAHLAAGEPVTEVAYRFGFASSQHFATAFRTHFGLTPTAYRSHARRRVV